MVPCRASAAPSGLPDPPNPLVDRQGSSQTAKSPSGLGVGGHQACLPSAPQLALFEAATIDLFDATGTRERPSDSAQIAEPRRILAGSKSELLWTASRRSSGAARFHSTPRSRPEAFIAVISISPRARAQDGNSDLARKLEVRSLRDARDQRREHPTSNFRLAA